MLKPILVCGTGRGGTTLLMQLFATSLRIAMHRKYVYEHCYYRYLLEWAALPLHERWASEHWNVGSLVFPATGSLNAGLMGPFPWSQRDLVGDAQALSRAWFRAAWCEFSRVAAQQTGAPSGQPVSYYAEKCDGVWTLTGVDWIPVKTVALVRDPRDVWLSILAFDTKRGYHGFGRHVGEPEAQYLDRFLEEQRQHLTWARSILASDQARVIYYESMATDLSEVARRLERWLGVHLDPHKVARERETFSHHLTTSSAAASVERWRDELSDARRMLFGERLAVELRAHGYEP